MPKLLDKFKKKKVAPNTTKPYRPAGPSTGRPVAGKSINARERFKARSNKVGKEQALDELVTHTKKQKEKKYKDMDKKKLKKETSKYL